MMEKGRWMRDFRQRIPKEQKEHLLELKMKRGGKGRQTDGGKYKRQEGETRERKRERE